jgi:Protein of unknown function (DUF3175)
LTNAKGSSGGYSPKAAKLVAAIVTGDCYSCHLRQRSERVEVPARERNPLALPPLVSKGKELSMAPRRKSPAKRRARQGTSGRWSQRVTRESDALDLKEGVFKLTSAKKIAASLKRSAEQSTRRKSGAYRSALSMLVFYINRAGKNLAQAERNRLERAKIELKHQFGRE